MRAGGLNFLGKRVFVNTITGEVVSRDVLHHNDGHGGDNASPMIMLNVDILIFFEKKTLRNALVYQLQPALLTSE